MSNTGVLHLHMKPLLVLETALPSSESGFFQGKKKCSVEFAVYTGII